MGHLTCLCKNECAVFAVHVCHRLCIDVDSIVICTFVGELVRLSSESSNLYAFPKYNDKYCYIIVYF